MRVKRKFRFSNSTLVPLSLNLVFDFPSLSLVLFGDSQKLFQGYIEGEEVFISSLVGGKLKELNVKKGAQVKKGSLLFALDDELKKAIVAESDVISGMKPTLLPAEVLPL